MSPPGGRTRVECVEFHSRLSFFPGGYHSPSPAKALLEKDLLMEDGSWWVNLLALEDFYSLRYQWPQLLTATVMGTLALYSDCLAQVYLQLHYTPTDVVLEDMGFSLLPYWKDTHASDYFLLIFVGATLSRFVVFTGPYSMRWTLIRRWFLLMGTLFLLRGFSIICTVLPNPEKECVSDILPGDHLSVFVEAWYIALGWRVTCADVLYSGHTVNFTLCLLIWYNYSHLCPLTVSERLRCYPLIKIFAIGWCMMGYIVIIMTHFHYTVDVWLGFWMTYFVWSFYHEAIKSSPFHDAPLMNFLTWMEAEATDLRYWRMRVQKVRALDAELRNQFWNERKNLQGSALLTDSLSSTSSPGSSPYQLLDPTRRGCAPREEAAAFAKSAGDLAGTGAETVSSVVA